MFDVNSEFYYNLVMQPIISIENVESLMLTNYPEVKAEWDNKEIEEKWSKINFIRMVREREMKHEKVIFNVLSKKMLFINIF